jgi:hypothetical protein
MNHKNSFQLEIGSLDNLKGNAVVYWNNSSSSQENILAINFCVSVFPFDDNLVVSTFPLTVFSLREEFMLYIVQSQCDLITMGESFLDLADDFYTLNKEQYQNLNRTIEIYLEFYRNNLIEKSYTLNIEGRFTLLLKLVEQFFQNMNKEKKAPLLYERSENKDLIKDPNFNSSYLLSLKKRILKFINKLFENSLISYNDGEMLIHLIESLKKGEIQKEELIRLYLKKFQALVREEYEILGKINKEIEIRKKSL